MTLAHYLWNSFFNVCSKHLEISQSCRAFSSKNWIRFRVSLESEKPFDLDLSQIWLNFLLFWWDLSLQPSMWSQFWFALFSLLLLAESQASQFFSKSILVKIHGYDNVISTETNGTWLRYRSQNRISILATLEPHKHSLPNMIWIIRFFIFSSEIRKRLSREVVKTRDGMSSG